MYTYADSNSNPAPMVQGCLRYSQVKPFNKALLTSAIMYQFAVSAFWQERKDLNPV